MEIKVINLTKKYGDFTAVDNVSFTAESCKILSLLGINGAGKTTTIKMMTGLISRTSGDILYDGNDIAKNTDTLKKIINVSPQETAIAPNLTVKENILFIANIYGKNKIDAKTFSDEIINEFSLEQVKNKKAKLLSGGMQRRLSIAMSLVTKPKVLFLDEPTLGLDVISRAQLWDLIEKLKDKMTIILTTHYMEEAQKLSDAVAIMNEGKIIAFDTPTKLISNTNSQSLEQAFIKLVKGAKI